MNFLCRPVVIVSINFFFNFVYKRHFIAKGQRLLTLYPKVRDGLKNVTGRNCCELLCQFCIEVKTEADCGRNFVHIACQVLLSSGSNFDGWLLIEFRSIKVRNFSSYTPNPFLTSNQISPLVLLRGWSLSYFFFHVFFSNNRCPIFCFNQKIINISSAFSF